MTSSKESGTIDLGVLLFNLGGPETLADVRPFLFNLFSDPDIIRIRSNVLRRTVAWLIATTRQGKSRGLYRQIGGGSPLRRITEAQAAALSERLAACGCRARVYVGMRCWKPTIDDAVAQIAADRVKQLVVLPLFPQFSVTTTGSCFNYFRAIAQKRGLSGLMQTFFVDAWFEDPLYLEAMTDMIREAQSRFSSQTPADIHLLYSAHSIPARYVEEGDPYLEQTQKTVALINGRLGSRFSFTLAFQSKVGPVKWLGPATIDVIAGLSGRRVERVLAIPISFVSDHIETLQEIDILYRELALKKGIREFYRAPSLNVYPKFIEALANISLKAVGNRQ
ncbi:MAG: ferrochelatase [Acidobacteriia bacterium]|nr:ferrochelatase [Terriglobia bacterium]